MIHKWLLVLVLLASPMGLLAEQLPHGKGKSEAKQDSAAPKLTASILAQFSPKKNSQADRRIFIYSKSALTNVEYRKAVGNWTAMSTASVDGGEYHAYTSADYLPTEAGAKYYVRGTREDGSRLTDILTATDPGQEPETAITVSGHRNETREELQKALASERAKGYPKSLEYAQSYLGKYAPKREVRPGLIGGGCCALGMGFDEIGRVTKGGTVTGSIVPGAIVEMRSWRVNDVAGGTLFSNEHYGVVESYDPATRRLTFLHQNPGPVRRTTVDLGSLSGTFIIRAAD